MLIILLFFASFASFGSCFVTQGTSCRTVQAHYRIKSFLFDMCQGRVAFMTHLNCSITVLGLTSIFLVRVMGIICLQSIFRV